MSQASNTNANGSNDTNTNDKENDMNATQITLTEMDSTDLYDLGLDSPSGAYVSQNELKIDGHPALVSISKPESDNDPSVSIFVSFGEIDTFTWGDLDVPTLDLALHVAKGLGLATTSAYLKQIGFDLNTEEA